MSTSSTSPTTAQQHQPPQPTHSQDSSQTRFSFYNADEYKVGGGSPTTTSSKSPKNGISPQQQQQQQRFHFYNANEIRLTETVLQTVRDDDDDETNNTATGITRTENKMDSTEILKSLQEHEQQRLSILTAKRDEDEEEEDVDEKEETESLLLLPEDDPPPPQIIKQSETNEKDLADHSPMIIQESRSAETDTDTLQSNPYQEAIHEALELLRRQKRSPYQQEMARQQRQERLQKYSARLQELKQDEMILPASSSLSSEQPQSDIPAVERVLLAILQKADTTEQQQQHQLHSDDGEHDDDADDEQEDDALLRAMSDLLPPRADDDDDDDLQSQDESDIPQQKQSQEDSIVGRRVYDDCRTPVPDSYSEGEEEHTPVYEKKKKTVLGPLGQQDTGVVLDHEELLDDEDSASCRSEDETSEPCTSSSDSASTATSSSAPTHILDSLSAAVSYMTGGVRSETDKNGDSKEIDEDEDDDDELEDDDDDTEEDTETAILRSLCAHLLPQSNIPRPLWDDSNPEELGYRIVRISNEQLERMEDELVELLEEPDERKNIVPIETAVAKSPEKKPEKSQSLGHFPGVKASGCGEMGDLEYFVLPVIYKSHVTGFEPVKDMVLEPGNVLAGQYLVEGVLGSAAFSTAYKCVDLSSNTEVCLKVIKNTKDFFDQSLDEIKILELLRQTGRCEENYIVEMKTFFYHREHLVIVTELLRQNLFEFGKFIMDSGEEPYFTLSRLAYVTRQCLISLRFVHSLGLVHSDVKPENILLSSYSRASVKLIDFGSSCYLTDRQSSYIQSRSYRAPEVCFGLPYDGRIDVWSLGCVVAEMYTGEVTFQNDSVVSMLSRIEAICGPFPRHMIVNGRQSSQFFTKTGLLYEREEDDAVDIFQPKQTSLANRLGCANNEVFLDFIRQVLTIDPELRPTAAQALEHPWMHYAASLSENDILYPQP